jgi:hypothetical protein
MPNDYGIKLRCYWGTLEELGETFGNLMGTPLATLETHSVQHLLIIVSTKAHKILRPHKFVF